VELDEKPETSSLKTDTGYPNTDAGIAKIKIRVLLGPDAP
jgi:hypothetical protein